MAIDLSVGSSSRVETTATALRDLPLGDFTLRAVVRVESGSSYNGILACTTSMWNVGWWWEVANNLDRTRLRVQYTGGGFSSYATTGSSMLGQWHDLCMTYEYATHMVRHYIDGASRGSGQASPTGSFAPSADSICRAGRLLPASHGISGKIAEAAIWRRALSAAQIESLAAGRLRAGCLPELLALWLPLDTPTSGAVAGGDLGVRDLSGNGRHGIVQGTVSGAADPPLHWPPQQVLAAANNAHGGYRLYRGGQDRGAIDYETPVAVVDPHEVTAALAGLGHEADSDTWYAVRAVSASGKEDQNVDVVARLKLDAAGQQAADAPPQPVHLTARAEADGRVSLRWRYDAEPDRPDAQDFRIYGDGGGGEIDWLAPLATVSCTGSGDYEWLSDELTDGVRCRFAVRARSAEGSEDEGTDTVAVIADGQAPAPVSVLISEGI